MSREQNVRILIADDHEDNVELLKARLEARGYEIIEAYDGEQALEKIKAERPDLILLDVMMPKMDGMEVARRVKADDDLPFTPIIMQTALDSTENKVEGLGAGADDYITKPINFLELEARISSLLRIKKLQNDLEHRERELAEMNVRLLRIAQVDGLTGLDNRRHLEERLQEMFEHAERLNEPLSCVMCDIDHFKSVNDTYGHQAGDMVLREFAEILKSEAREIDRIGRYGGEEFVLLLPGTVLDAAVTFAERVREAVEHHTFEFENRTIRRTASFGIAGWPHPDVGHREALIKAADDALYVAKELGRNRVIRFDGNEFNAHIQATQDGDNATPAESHAPVADVLAGERSGHAADRSRAPGSEDPGAAARA